MARHRGQTEGTASPCFRPLPSPRGQPRGQQGTEARFSPQGHELGMCETGDSRGDRLSLSPARSPRPLFREAGQGTKGTIEEMEA